MSGTRYLKDRLGLYLLFSAVVILFAAVVLLLPYDTVYVRNRTYLTIFLVTIILCVAPSTTHFCGCAAEDSWALRSDGCSGCSHAGFDLRAGGLEE